MCSTFQNSCDRDSVGIHVRLELESAGIVEPDARGACRQQREHRRRAASGRSPAMGLTRRTRVATAARRTDDKRRQHPAIFIVPKQRELDGDARQPKQQEREQQLTKSVRRVTAHAGHESHASEAALTAHYSPSGAE